MDGGGENEIYDAVVIGAGIAGLYVAERLAAKGERVMVLERNGYLGGRVFTHPTYKYECGAARFHDSHTLLRGLLRKYKLKTFPLPTEYDYIARHDREKMAGANHYFDEQTKDIVRKLKGRSTSFLMNQTMLEACRKAFPRDDDEMRLWRDVFGYTSEVRTLNAYDAVRTFDEEFVGKRFHVVGGGLSQLIRCLEKDIKRKGGRVETDATVRDIVYHNYDGDDGKRTDAFEIHASYKDKNKSQSKSSKRNGAPKLRSLYARKCVLAIPPNAMKDIPYVKRNVGTRTLSAAKGEPLLRLYAQYDRTGRDEVWFHGMRRTTTDSFLRHIIPIDEKSGMIMVSYTDGVDTKPFAKGEGDALLLKMVHDELRALFPERDIPDPRYFKKHLWPDGAYYWRAGMDSRVLSKQMVQPIDGVPLYTCGEGFSMKQAWMEGALETAADVLRVISRN